MFLGDTFGSFFWGLFFGFILLSLMPGSSVARFVNSNAYSFSILLFLLDEDQILLDLSFQIVSDLRYAGLFLLV